MYKKILFLFLLTVQLNAKRALLQNGDVLEDYEQVLDYRVFIEVKLFLGNRPAYSDLKRMVEGKLSKPLDHNAEFLKSWNLLDVKGNLMPFVREAFLAANVYTVFDESGEVEMRRFVLKRLKKLDVTLKEKLLALANFYAQYSLSLGENPFDSEDFGSKSPCTFTDFECRKIQYLGFVDAAFQLKPHLFLALAELSQEGLEV